MWCCCFKSERPNTLNNETIWAEEDSKIKMQKWGLITSAVGIALISLGVFFLTVSVCSVCEIPNGFIPMFSWLGQTVRFETIGAIVTTSLIGGVALKAFSHSLFKASEPA